MAEQLDRELTVGERASIQNHETAADTRAAEGFHLRVADATVEAVRKNLDVRSYLEQQFGSDSTDELLGEAAAATKRAATQEEHVAQELLKNGESIRERGLPR